MESLFVVALGLGIIVVLWHESLKRRRNKVRAQLDATSRRLAAQQAEIEQALHADEDAANDLVSNQNAQYKREQVYKAEFDKSISEQDQANNELICFVDQHKQVLLTKQRQLTYYDDYGRCDMSAFNKELDYFVEKVVPNDIRGFYVKYNNEHATLVMTATVRIRLMETEQVIASTGLSYDAQMSGVEFEQLVAERLERAGAEVHSTPATGDQGADLIVQHDGGTIVIQCKRSASTVGNKAVQEAYAGRKFHDAEHAWVVSDAPFSRQARQLANSLSVRLVHFDHVETAL